MFSIVLLVALANLLVGYGLAVWLATPNLPPAIEPPHPPEDHAIASAAEPPPDYLPESEPAPLPNFKAEIPPEWLVALEAEGIVAKTLVEATAQVMRLEVGRYREELVQLEATARDAQVTGVAASFERVRLRLTNVNAAWLGVQRQAAETLHAKRDSLAEFAQIGEQLEAVLFDQAAQIEATDGVLRDLPLAREPELGGKQLLVELGRLLDLAHRLRDGMQEAVATILAAESRLDTVAEPLHQDAATEALSRLGLEVLYRDWWQNGESRQLSVALIDVDRFSRINVQHGIRAADDVLVEFARILRKTVRVDRGYDRVCRIGGQSFLAFYGFTGPRQANAAVERFRQTVEATSFELKTGAFDLTISAGVIEARASEPLAALLSRARQTLTEAKRKGRNRVAVDEGSGPSFIEPLQYKVQGQVIDFKSEPAEQPA